MKMKKKIYSITNNECSEENEKIDVEKKEEKPKDKLPETVSTFGLLRYSNCSDIALMMLGLVCAIIHGAGLPGVLFIMGKATDGFVNSGRYKSLLNDLDYNKYNVTKDEALNNKTILHHIIGRENLTTQYNTYKNAHENLLDDMRKYSSYYAIIALAIFIIGTIQNFSWKATSQRQSFKIRNLLFKSILKQNMGWFDTQEIGEINTRLTEDVNVIQDGLGSSLALSLQQATTLILGFIIAFIKGWKLALVILSCIPLMVITGSILGGYLGKLTKRELDAYAKSGSVAEEVLSAIRTVMAFNGGKKECKRYNENLSEAEHLDVKKSILFGVFMGALFMIIFGGYALAFWYGSKLVHNNEYTVGDMLTVLYAIMFGVFSVGQIAPGLQNFSGAKGAAYVIYKIIDTIPPIDSSSTAGERPARIVGRVTFENIWFKYPSRPDVPILNGLNLDITPGETVALVGSSGCGKSTTIQLLQRFYDPLQGKVTIDGKDIRELNVEWLRQSIGVVSQEPVLFATTIEENIRYGREGVSLDEIHEAAKSANAYNFIMQLPDQFNTLVGERGAQLSGGQKQRIAIARALVRNPKILLLDEATSALDTESEGIVQEALDEARRGRTTIVVAHRLSTVRTADKIVGFKEGKKIEEGAHDDLMKIQGGVYHHLVTSQSAKEVDDDDDDDDDDNDELASSVSKVEFENEKNKLGKTLSQFSNNVNVKESFKTKKESEKVAEGPFSRVMKLNGKEWKWIVAGTFAAVINGGIQPAFSFILGEILGVFALSDIDEQRRKINFYSLGLVGIGIVMGILNTIQNFSFGKSGSALTKRIRKMAFEKLMRKEIAYFDNPNHAVGALTTQLGTDASAVRGVTGSRIGSLIQAFSTMIVGIVIAFVYSWKLTLALFIFVPISIVGGAIQVKLSNRQQIKDQSMHDESGELAVETITNMRTVAQLSKERDFYKRYHDFLKISYKQSFPKDLFASTVIAFTSSSMFFAYAVCFVLGGYLIDKDELNYGDMFIVFGAVVFSSLGAGQANSMAPDYGKGKAAANRLFKLFDSELEIDSFSEEGEVLPQVSGDVSFSDVTFRYPSRPDVPVLRGLTLKANKGETLALVGTSGCGKSTAISLLERFYNPLSGLITLDEHSIDKMNVQWLRSQIGIVQQEPILFDRSIADNIAYGDNSRQVSMDEIIKAAKDANIHDFISNLPDGYETRVGDKGTQLSGGQKQRVAIARAMVKNPKILLLDEATSALDTESERVVQEALDKAQIGRTSIVIAHRLSTIHNADQIAVIHLGKVVELGTHSELMNKQGKYYKLYTHQSAQK
ncbi:DgyrCDS5856 [Dimorphilus gyrociliatus]|uniref:DgyrCDS5856 n=1 Tax=Dimorphilus gyrociliatus TaxID=2664684 RepID=A0A7I8VNI4_9ANNE|nr:DgyrCDS5856 [Dimorphilus gyrociliatus]